MSEPSVHTTYVCPWRGSHSVVPLADFLFCLQQLCSDLADNWFMGGRIPGPLGSTTNTPTGASFASPQPVGAPGAIIVVPGGLLSARPLLTPQDVEAAARHVQRSARSTGRELDRQTRLAFEEAAIRIGRLPYGFPRELLHRYIFGHYETLYLTTAQFLTKVGPIASVFDPNKATGGTEYPNELQADIAAKTASLTNNAAISFKARYSIGAFHGAHSTGGLGRMRLHVQVDVTARSATDWEIAGTAILKPEKWDFDWTWRNLFRELRDGGVSLDKTDLHGRERRTALGARIPGQRFYVAMTAPLNISQIAGEDWATFSA